jgi:hypothetical protein
MKKKGARRINGRRGIRIKEALGPSSYFYIVVVATGILVVVLVV